MQNSAPDRNVLDDLALGALAGCIATVPMTWAMEAMHRRLPQEERYPLPPRQIAMRVAEDVGVKEHLDQGERLGVTLLAHFGMGSAAGALYGLLVRPQRLPGPPGWGNFWPGSLGRQLPRLAARAGHLASSYRASAPPYRLDDRCPSRLGSGRRHARRLAL